MNLVKLLLIGLTMTALTACSKTVRWEEEVLLNTGETIWVTKEVRYTIKGQPGNPMDMGYLPDFKEVTSFKYKDRSYTYTGDAQPMVLAISPRKLPVLLATASGNDWDKRNSFKCTTPYYVQFMPRGVEMEWTWLDKIEPWTYNLPVNLMLTRDPPSEVKRRYTIADKAQQPYLRDPQIAFKQKIDPQYTGINCTRSN